ncbi:MAG: YceD family protein [Candidatus Nanopelagicaceae bacterium]
MSVKAFRFNTHDLPRRAGEMKQYQLTIDLQEPIGIDVIAVPKGPLELDLKLESVAEGVLATGEFEVIAKGECIRCLDPVEIEINKSFQELYSYKPNPDLSEEEQADQLLMDGDYIDLELPIRDGIVLSLPINPVCTDECEGLCPECGLKWSELPMDHAHEQVDPRWSGLKGLFDLDK